VFSVVEIGPRRYNELMDAARGQGSRNTLLTWARVRAISVLLKQGAYTDSILIDRHMDPTYVRARLRNDLPNRQLELVTRGDPEARILTAAASIVAQEKVLAWFSKTAFEHRMPIPRGEAADVASTARSIVARFGEKKLSELAKLQPART
jgi:ribonuclease HIII